MNDILFEKELGKLDLEWKIEWISLLFLNDNLEDRKSYYSAIIDNEKIPEIMNNYSWDVSLWYWKPWFIFYWNWKTEYKWIWADWIDYLVYYRIWSWKDDRIFEISQEFILYYDLYYRESSYIKINNDWEEEIIIKISNNKVEAKLKYIKEFLAIKNKKLVIYFDLTRFLREEQESYFNKENKKEDIFYKFVLWKADFWENKSFSRVFWKKIINWKEWFTPVIYEEKDYENFYIWVDENWEDKYYTCNPDKLSDYFWDNSEAPNFLTPIVFEKEVLNKYFTNPIKYTVSDSTISMHWFWSLNIDNNLWNKVAVFLWDLWRDLSFKEQKYWKNFEIKEKWKISNTYYKRSIEWEFCDPEEPDLFFKNKYNDFNERWNEKFWWRLFNNFSDSDKYLLRSLHSLTSENNQKEFDEQVLTLTKILIDYLNDREIYKNVEEYLKEKEDKRISKLDKFLISKNSKNTRLTKFFKDLQFLRSKWSGHNKNEKDYKKALLNFSDESMSLKEIFDEILVQSVEMLNTLEIRFLI